MGDHRPCQLAGVLGNSRIRRWSADRACHQVYHNTAHQDTLAVGWEQAAGDPHRAQLCQPIRPRPPGTGRAHAVIGQACRDDVTHG